MKQSETDAADAKTTTAPKLRFPEFRKGEMWHKSELGKEAFILKGKGISKSDVHPDGSQPCIRYGELYTHYSEIINSIISKTKVSSNELFLSRDNDVIIPSSGETKIDIATASCVLLNGVALGGDLNVIRSKLYGPFLSYYLNGPKRFEIAKVAQGDSVVHLYPYQLEALKIAFPSYAEQKKIAECLITLNELIEGGRQNLAALKAHKKGLMQQLFPREGKTIPRLRFPEFRDAEEWKEEQLGNSCSAFSGGTPSTSQKEFYGGTVPFIRSAEINKKITELYLTDLGIESSAAKLVQKGDVLVALYGANSGDVALAQIDGAINQAILCLKPLGDRPFLYHYLSFKKDWIVSTYIQGGQGNLSGEIIKSIALKFPRLPEQQRIASCLSSLDELIAAQSDKLETHKSHKHGLMQQLFPSPTKAEP